MRGIQTRTLRRLRRDTGTGVAALGIVLLILSGCATYGTGKAPVSHESRETKEPSVTRFEDGREGFIITEFPQMNDRSRRNFGHAVAMLEEQNYEQAIDLLLTVIKESPGVTAPYIDIAIAYQAIGKPEQAEEYLDTALELFPDHPVACNEYGLLYRRTGRFAEAREIYEKAITRFPDYYPAHKNLGILCDLYLKDSSCALEHYEIYSAAKPEDEQVKLWIADLRTGLGRN